MTAADERGSGVRAALPVLLIAPGALPPDLEASAVQVALLPLNEDSVLPLLRGLLARPEPGPLSALDTEHRALLDLLSHGKTTESIARRLRVSRRTVERRLSALRRKAGAVSNAHLVALYTASKDPAH